MKGNQPMKRKDKKPKIKKNTGAKPDYLDFDKDGNRTEPMKQALAQRKKKNGTPAKMGKATNGISKKEEAMLSEHADHHSVKHMNQMRKDMKNGMSFTMAHKRAMSKVGK